MGQYYRPVNVEKMEFLYSHNFDNGLKLMEHSYIGNNFMKAVERLLSPNGGWHRCRLVWAGDYADDGLFIPKGVKFKDSMREYVPNLYDYVDKEGSDPTEFEADHNEDYDIRMNKAKKAMAKFTAALPKAGTFLVNWTKGVYLDITKEDNGDKWVIHPLSLLTCSGNGRGGGDYLGENEVVGSWAGDEISMEYEAPDGLELLDPLNIKE